MHKEINLQWHTNKSQRAGKRLFLVDMGIILMKKQTESKSGGLKNVNLKHF